MIKVIFLCKMVSSGDEIGYVALLKTNVQAGGPAINTRGLSCPCDVFAGAILFPCGGHVCAEGGCV